MGKARKRKTSTQSAKATAAVKKVEKEKEDEVPKTFWSTLSNIATNFPLISASITVGIPYGIYLLYFVILLQKPHWFSLRPGLSDVSERQVLIMGTMGSGTTQVSEQLSETFSVEVSHEVADAKWHFSRDGTVSWFHGIRYFNDADANALCHRDLVKNMGFHPRMFTSLTTCSTREDWSTCWQRECRERVSLEQDCVRRNDCPTPFRVSLWQTRHPLRTIESLVTKFCVGESLEDGVIHETFTQLLEAMFHIDERLSCIESVGTYVVEYSKRLMQARKEGLIDGVFPVESTSPCAVVEMAGFLDDAVYPPHSKRIESLCQDNPAQLFAKKKNQRNKGRLSLDWSDLRGAMHRSLRPQGDSTLEKQVRDLTKELGYEL